MDFYGWLAEAAERNESLLCVGLDPRPERLATGKDLFGFTRHVVDVTHDLVCAYKPNFAFYEAAGTAGLEVLREIIDYVHDAADVPVILDAKRGDIGSTAEAYARAAFEVWGADAVTVNPYLGGDSIRPFTAYGDRGVFLLCHTSNPGAADLQHLRCPTRPLYEIVAEKAERWGTALVVGATYPEALGRVRELAPEAWILLPGVGAQGGDLEGAVAAGLRSDGLGLVVNVSRGVLDAADPRQAAVELRQRINDARSSARAVESGRGKEGTARERLSVALADIGAVQFGEFTLASGQRSPIYIDLRLVASYPEVLRRVAQAYAELIRNVVGVPAGQGERDAGALGPSDGEGVCLAAIPYAALPIGTVVSLELDLPLIYPRKEAKSYGTGREIEGRFRAGDRAIVLDDLITTGGSKLAAIAPLEAAGLVVQDVVVLIDREQGGRDELDAAGYRLHAVLLLSEMVEALANAGRISEGQRAEVMELLGR